MKPALYPIIFLFIFAINSCKKAVDVDLPINKITSPNVFADDKTATAAVLGLYSKMAATAGTFSNGTTSIYLGLASDELKYMGTASEILAFNTNIISADNGLLYSNFWTDPYKIIYQANACIEGLNSSSAVTNEVKKQLLGEAYFVRAFCYWYLQNVFGDVPLLLSSDYQTNAQSSRNTSLQVTSQIIQDLEAARSMLSKSYPTSSKLRPNYYVATALLSRVYLKVENWKGADETAGEIIGSGAYSLETDLSKCFLIGSKEALWQLAIPDAQIINTIEGNRFIPVSSVTVVPNYVLTPSLLSAFEGGDLRRTNWVGTKTVSGVSYQYPYKYKVRSNAVKSEHCIVFRLPELYLNRAEARCHLNNLPGALSDLNEIKKRANPSGQPFSNTTQSVVESAISKEKRIEFFAEWGMRWFDLVRTGQIEQVISTEKTTWTSKAKLFPIPSAEIQLNPNLSQNPGF
ncbi:RagB/SusD family nutrient uptake outer membrane protein [Chryseobacterium sp. SL1]|uniref:RagB/SusD family nutrient uptake outer membrane protein n=1 Tax=Chryseobacterium sp. SL1 TaxID=2995159 RepID=UPI002276A802|nr:RagB/SusD family nutrient uptake outer membrane protein [Chryseobacterium sp. SL1]MCY1662577.1 RagB/SusD family nutrient uptake outer membrane protein [Chryseobacterium sp. SL1]